MLIFSSITITLALVFYSLGIWAERIARMLKGWHVISFWTGFVFDVTGTTAMHYLAGGKMDFSDPHTLTGQLALWLMLFHAIWASVVIRKNLERQKKVFHRYSLVVWLIWLIPYFGGMILAMS